MSYYAFMFILSRAQIVQYNYRLQKINSGGVQDLIKADVNLYLEYKLSRGEGFLAALKT